MSTFDSSTTTHPSVMLRDGRSLGYVECGNPKGKPGFRFHGHPGSRLEFSLFTGAATKTGIRLVRIDQLGKGLSDFVPDRKILDWPNDVVQLAGALEIDRFRVDGDFRTSSTAKLWLPATTSLARSYHTYLRVCSLEILE